MSENNFESDYDEVTICNIVKRVIPIIYDLRIAKIRQLEIAGLEPNIRKHTLDMCSMSINDFCDSLIQLLEDITSETDDNLNLN